MVDMELRQEADSSPAITTWASKVPSKNDEDYRQKTVQVLSTYPPEELTEPLAKLISDLLVDRDALLIHHALRCLGACLRKDKTSENAIIGRLIMTCTKLVISEFPKSKGLMNQLLSFVHDDLLISGATAWTGMVALHDLSDVLGTFLDFLHQVEGDVSWVEPGWKYMICMVVRHFPKQLDIDWGEMSRRIAERVQSLLDSGNLNLSTEQKLLEMHCIHLKTLVMLYPTFEEYTVRTIVRSRGRTDPSPWADVSPELKASLDQAFMSLLMRSGRARDVLGVLLVEPSTEQVLQHQTLPGILQYLNILMNLNIIDPEVTVYIVQVMLPRALSILDSQPALLLCGTPLKRQSTTHLYSDVIFLHVITPIAHALGCIADDLKPTLMNVLLSTLMNCRGSLTQDLICGTLSVIGCYLDGGVIGSLVQSLFSALLENPPLRIMKRLQLAISRLWPWIPTGRKETLRRRLFGMCYSDTCPAAGLLAALCAVKPAELGEDLRKAGLRLSLKILAREKKPMSLMIQALRFLAVETSFRRCSASTITTTLSKNRLKTSQATITKIVCLHLGQAFYHRLAFQDILEILSELPLSEESVNICLNQTVPLPGWFLADWLTNCEVNDGNPAHVARTFQAFRALLEKNVQTDADQMIVARAVFQAARTTQYAAQFKQLVPPKIGSILWANFKVFEGKEDPRSVPTVDQEVHLMYSVVKGRRNPAPCTEPLSRGNIPLSAHVARSSAYMVAFDDAKSGSQASRDDVETAMDISQAYFVSGKAPSHPLKQRSESLAGVEPNEGHDSGKGL